MYLSSHQLRCAISTVIDVVNATAAKHSIDVAIVTVNYRVSLPISTAVCLLLLLLLLSSQPDPSAGATRAILVEAREYALPTSTQPLLAQGLSEGPEQGLSEGPAQGLSEGPAQGLSEGPAQGLGPSQRDTATTTPTIAGMFLLGAYYRPLCLCVRDQECVDMGRRLCMLLGR